MKRKKKKTKKKNPPRPGIGEGGLVCRSTGLAIVIAATNRAGAEGVDQDGGRLTLRFRRKRTSAAIPSIPSIGLLAIHQFAETKIQG